MDDIFHHGGIGLPDVIHQVCPVLALSCHLKARSQLSLAHQTQMPGIGDRCSCSCTLYMKLCMVCPVTLTCAKQSSSKTKDCNRTNGLVMCMLLYAPLPERLLYQVEALCCAPTQNLPALYAGPRGSSVHVPDGQAPERHGRTACALPGWPAPRTLPHLQWPL